MPEQPAIQEFRAIVDGLELPSETVDRIEQAIQKAVLDEISNLDLGESIALHVPPFSEDAERAFGPWIYPGMLNSDSGVNGMVVQPLSRYNEAIELGGERSHEPGAQAVELAAEEQQKLEEAANVFGRLANKHELGEDLTGQDKQEAQQAAKQLAQFMRGQSNRAGIWNQAFDSAIAQSDLSEMKQELMRYWVLGAGGFVPFVVQHMEAYADASPLERGFSDETMCNVGIGLLTSGTVAAIPAIATGVGAIPTGIAIGVGAGLMYSFCDGKSGGGGGKPRSLEIKPHAN